MAAPIVTRLILNTTSFQAAARGASAALKPISAGLSTIAGMASKAAFAFAGLSAAFAAITIRQTGFISRLNDTAQKLGINVEFLQKFRYAAEQSGVSIETADMALQRFTRRVAEAARNTGEARGAIAQLGIRIKDTNGNLRPMEDILLDVADGIAKTTDEAERVRLAFKFFDSEGVALVNTLQGGSSALEAMFGRAQSLGYVLSADAAQGAKDFDDALTDMRVLITGVTNQLTAALAPALEAATMRFIEFVQQFADSKGGFEALGLYLKDQLIVILQNVIRAFVALYNAVVTVINGVQQGLARLGLIDNVAAIKQTIAELRAESEKGFFDREQFKVLIGAHKELRDEFGNFEYFDDEDYAKAIRILERKAAEVEASGTGISMLQPISQETLESWLKFWNDYTEAGKEANGAIATQIEEITVKGQAMGFTFAKLMDDIFGVERMTRFWETFDDESSNAMDKVKAIGELLFSSLQDFITGIADRIEASGIGDYMRTLEDGFISAVQKFEDTLADAILTGKADFSDLGDHIKKVFAKALVQKFITAPLMAAFGLPGLALGGPAKAGQPYIVGERGPELFVPNQSGRVISNDETMDMMGNGGAMMGGPTQVTYNINATDAKSFKDLVARDPQFIYAVTQAGARRTPR